LDESLTLIRNRLGHGAAIRFRDDLELGIEANLVRLEWITEAREREAMALFRRYDDKPKLSFTDCTSFIVMRLLDIRLAFTADEHFERTDPQNLPFRRLIDQRAGRYVFLERLL
jgi:predicted nucleic acid-binding protein